MTSLVIGKLVGGGVVKLERVQVICPACGQQVEAVASDGHIKGYCTVANQYVNFLIETQLAPRSVVRIDNPDETRAKLSASAKKLWQDPEFRAKVSSAMKKKWQDPEYQAKQIATHTGRHPSSETKAKISAAHTGKHHTAETRAKLSASLRR